MAKRGAASRAVRKYLMEHPDAKPRAVAEALKRYKVTANLVSNIKSRMKHQLDAVSVAAVAGAADAPLAIARRQRASLDSMERLRAAVELIRKCGSVASARETLDLAEEIARVAGR